jgi:hypothetical protein
MTFGGFADRSTFGRLRSSFEVLPASPIVRRSVGFAHRSRFGGLCSSFDGR